MAKKKTQEELSLEIKMLRRHGIGNNFTKIVRDLIKYGFLFGVSYFSYLSIDSLSGKITHADISMNATGSMSVESSSTVKFFTDCRTVGILAIIFGVGGILYGRRQANLRRDVIEKFNPYKIAIEKKIDPERSTSKLLSRGDTRPEDI